MVKIDGTKITMTRGDTLLAHVIMMRDGEAYTPTDGDSIRFALKHTAMNDDRTEYSDQTPLVNKAIPTDTMLLQLNPADTKELGFGTYVYDIEITFADGMVDTFITEAKFILKPEVH